MFKKIVFNVINSFIIIDTSKKINSKFIKIEEKNIKGYNPE